MVKASFLYFGAHTWYIIFDRTHLSFDCSIHLLTLLCLISYTSISGLSRARDHLHTDPPRPHDRLDNQKRNPPTLAPALRTATRPRFQRALPVPLRVRAFGARRLQN